MGQQQLLLLVLGVVIVAIATVAGMYAFEENLKKSNADLLVSDAINLASLAQGWKARPSVMGGQAAPARNNPKDFSGFDFGDLSLPNPHYTPNGYFTVQADPMGLVITGVNEEYDNQVTVTVTGTADQNIVAVVTNYVDAIDGGARALTFE